MSTSHRCIIGITAYPVVRPDVEQLTREALLAMVECGILEVVKPHPDPLIATYRMIDPDGVRAALDEIEGV